MIFNSYKITIRRSRISKKEDTNHKLQWFGSSLGLFSLRDKDKSCFRLFIELLKYAKINMPLSSDELAYKLNLSRGTVVHHLNKLIEAGLVITERNRYILRSSNLELLLDEMEKDIKQTLEDIRKIASDLDKELNL